MDEATAAVDVEADALIQAAVDEISAENHLTVLTIAHRLHTIMGYDTCLGLENGRKVEHDTPFKLLSRPDSLLCGLVAEADAETQAKLKQVAVQTHARASTGNPNRIKRAPEEQANFCGSAGTAARP